MIALSPAVWYVLLFSLFLTHSQREAHSRSRQWNSHNEPSSVTALPGKETLCSSQTVQRFSHAWTCLSSLVCMCLSHFILMHLTSSLVRRNCNQPLSSASSMRVWHDPDTYVTRIASIRAVCVLFMPWLHVSLPTVQLGKMRLMIPCRALTCSHLQCFDATLYIQMNEKKPTWVCPVCDKKAPYEHLIIDG